LSNIVSNEDTDTNNAILYLKKIEPHLNGDNKETIEIIFRDLFSINDYKNMQDSLENIFEDGCKLLNLIVEGVDETSAVKAGINVDIIRWVNKLSKIYGCAISKLFKMYNNPLDWEYVTLGKIQYDNGAIELKLDIFRYDKNLVSIQGDVPTIFALLRNISKNLKIIDLDEMDEETEGYINETIDALNEIKSKFDNK
jgi:hypothetical protein